MPIAGVVGIYRLQQMGLSFAVRGETQPHQRI